MTTGIAKDKNGMSNFSDTKVSGTHQATVAARYAVDSDSSHGAVIPPLYLSSNFAFEGYGQKRQYDYTRSGNPTRDALGDALAALEGGAGAVVTPSGMAALTLITTFLKPGDLMIAPHDCYGGTFRLFTSLAKKGHFELELIDHGLEELLAHPVKRHYLIRHIPADIRSRLLFDRKYIFSVHELACRLCYIGVLQFGPQKLKEKDQVSQFLSVLFD